MHNNPNAQKYADETYDYFTDPSKYPDEKDKGQPWYDAFMVKHVELSKLVRLDDGQYVFREWADQFKARTMDGIAEEILQKEGGEQPLVLSWLASGSHEEWLRTNVQTGDGPFIAVMEYGATGEGQTVQVIAHHARSLAEFILYCGQEVQGYYFVIGMDFYDGLDAAKDDYWFSKAVPEDMHSFFSKNCNVDINIKYHVNCS